MKAIKVTYQHRNDFKAVFKCELCGHEYEAWGYSDDYFLNTVMPNATCPACWKNSLGETPAECEARMGREFHIM